MDYFINILPSMLKGTVTTLQLFALVIIASLPLGWLVALGRVSKNRVISKTLEAYTWVMRGTPLMLQLMFIYYALPFIGRGIVIERFPAAFIAFVLNYAAYFAEIFRGGIQSIELGQYEAAEVLGMTKAKTMMRIIFPQAFKRVMPSIGNEVITLVKDTALAYVITISELMRAATLAVSRDFDSRAYIIAAIIYLLLTFIVTKLVELVEKSFSYYN